MRALVMAGIVGAGGVATAGVAAAQPRDTPWPSDAEWVAQCRDDHQRWNDERAVHCEVRVVDLPRPGAGTALAVDGRPYGGAVIRGGDGDRVVVHARIQTRAATQAAADAAARAVTVRTGGNRVVADGPPESDRAQWSVLFAIDAPRSLDLDVTTQHGPAAIRDVRGTIRVAVLNGPLGLDGVAGDVHARSVNGPLTVRLTGARWDGVGLDAETQNGPVALTIPDGYSTALEAGTVTGPQHWAPMAAITPPGPGTGRIHATLGRGGAPVRVVTTNGPFAMRQESP